MRLRRRAGEPIGLAVLLALMGVLLERPVILLGSVALGTWFLARQYRFVRAVRSLENDLLIDQTTVRTLVSTGEPVTLTLDGSIDRDPELAVTIDATPPLSSRMEGPPPTIRLGTLQRSVTSTDLTFPVAGGFELPPPTVTAIDSLGWFETTFENGPAVDVIVEPRRPRSLHVGEGGDALLTALGEHDAGRFGSGLTPAELREYVPGDSASRIDWKSTARLGQTYVRVFEAETDLETMVVLDHRSTMRATARDGTKLDYLREVALAYSSQARELGDPLGFVSVGDEGWTGRRWPNTRPEQYDWITNQLLAVEPTNSSEADRDVRTETSPARARELSHRLTGDTAMDRSLRPFFDELDPYVKRIRGQPLYETVRVIVERSGGNRLTIIFTDDEHRTEVRESVKLARQGSGRVLVFLSPSVLFDGHGLLDLDRTYRRYVAFEKFRRNLAALDRVTAFEVAPGERLNAVLAADARRRSVA